MRSASILNPQSSILNPQSSILNPEPRGGRACRRNLSGRAGLAGCFASETFAFLWRFGPEASLYLPDLLWHALGHVKRRDLLGRVSKMARGT